MKPRPANSESMYGFSHIALQLNYLTPELKERLPPTDSRLRPDQRALENGESELAIKEKHRLEENQRARRRELEKSGKTYKPAYFEEREHPLTGDTLFMFTGKYWEDRHSKNWAHLTPIFD